MKRTPVLVAVVSVVASLLVLPLPAGALLVTEQPETVAPRVVDTTVSYEHMVFTGEYEATEGVSGLSLGTGLLQGAGIVRGLDLSVSIPYVRIEEEDPRERFEATDEPDPREPEEGLDAAGLGDLEVALKWHFLEQAGAYPSMAARLGVSLPTGDEDEGLGCGKTVVSVGYLAGLRIEGSDAAVLLNARAYYIVDAGEEAKDVVSECSLAVCWQAADALGISAEVVASTAAEREGHSAATAAAVAEYALRDWILLQAGLRFGLTEDAPDWGASAGVNLCFGGGGE